MSIPGKAPVAGLLLRFGKHFASVQPILWCDFHKNDGDVFCFCVQRFYHGLADFFCSLLFLLGGSPGQQVDGYKRQVQHPLSFIKWRVGLHSFSQARKPEDSIPVNGSVELFFYSLLPDKKPLPPEKAKEVKPQALIFFPRWLIFQETMEANAPK